MVLAILWESLDAPGKLFDMVNLERLVPDESKKRTLFSEELISMPTSNVVGISFTSLIVNLRLIGIDLSP
jgi:hypothetical protein